MVDLQVRPRASFHFDKPLTERRLVDKRGFPLLMREDWKKEAFAVYKELRRVYGTLKGGKLWTIRRYFDLDGDLDGWNFYVQPPTPDPTDGLYYVTVYWTHPDDDGRGEHFTEATLSRLLAGRDKSGYEDWERDEHDRWWLVTQAMARPYNYAVPMRRIETRG